MKRVVFLGLFIVAAGCKQRDFNAEVDPENASDSQSIAARGDHGKPGRILFSLPYPKIKDAVCIYSRKNIGDKEFKDLENAIQKKDRSKIIKVLKPSSNVNVHIIPFSQLQNNHTALFRNDMTTFAGAIATFEVTAFTAALVAIPNPFSAIAPVTGSIAIAFGAGTLAGVNQSNQIKTTMQNANNIPAEGPVTLSREAVIDAIEAVIRGMDKVSEGEVECPKHPAI